jgi:hypothetical protein
MGAFATMAFVFGLMAVLLIGGFLFMWSRDKNRSNSVADDPERFGTDSAPHNGPTNSR